MPRAPSSTYFATASVAAPCTDACGIRSAVLWICGNGFSFTLE